MTLGRFIARYLDENNLSISEFGRKCGISKAYVSMLIKGINPANGEPLAPSVKIMDKLARGMNVSVDELFRNVDSMVTVNDNEPTDTDGTARLPGYFNQYIFDEDTADLAHKLMKNPILKEILDAVEPLNDSNRRIILFLAGKLKEEQGK